MAAQEAEVAAAAAKAKAAAETEGAAAEPMAVEGEGDKAAGAGVKRAADEVAADGDAEGGAAAPAKKGKFEATGQRGKEGGGKMMVRHEYYRPFDNERWLSIKALFGVTDNFPDSQLYGRSDGSPKTVTFLTQTITDNLFSKDERQDLKVGCRYCRGGLRGVGWVTTRGGLRGVGRWVTTRGGLRGTQRASTAHHTATQRASIASQCTKVTCIAK